MKPASIEIKKENAEEKKIEELKPKTIVVKASTSAWSMDWFFDEKFKQYFAT